MDYISIYITLYTHTHTIVHTHKAYTRICDCCFWLRKKELCQFSPSHSTHLVSALCSILSLKLTRRVTGEAWMCNVKKEFYLFPIAELCLQKLCFKIKTEAPLDTGGFRSSLRFKQQLPDVMTVPPSRGIPTGYPHTDSGVTTAPQSSVPQVLPEDIRLKQNRAGTSRILFCPKRSERVPEPLRGLVAIPNHLNKELKKFTLSKN